MARQRIKHSLSVEILDDDGRAIEHTPELITKLFDEELAKLALSADAPDEAVARLREARLIAEELIRRGEFTPA